MKKKKKKFIQKSFRTKTKNQKRLRVCNGMVELLGGGNDACVNELIPRVGQARQAPMDAIGVGGGVSLLLRSQHFALTNGINGGMCVFAVLREGGDIEEMDRHFYCLRYVHRDVEQPTVRPHFQRRRHVQYWHCLFCAFYPLWIVPIQAPIVKNKI